MGHPADYQRCKTCKWWDNIGHRDPTYLHRPCNNQALGDMDGKTSDTACDAEAYGGILTGPDFGCVHWEAKEGA